MTDMVMGLVIGFSVGSVLLTLLLYLALKQVRGEQAGRLNAQEETIADLRQELAEDKETNRHLRHQLHSLSTGASGLSPMNGGLVEGEVDINTALEERDDARRQLAEAQRSIESIRARLEDDREAKLREYREAVKEIRLSLESQDRLRGLVAVTDEIPINVQPAD